MLVEHPLSPGGATLAVDEVEALGVSVVTPGRFVDLMQTAAPKQVEGALLKSISDLRAPPYTKADLLDVLRLYKADQATRHYASKWKVSTTAMAARPPHFSPLVRPSSASRLWNTLKMSK